MLSEEISTKIDGLTQRLGDLEGFSTYDRSKST